MRCIKIIPFLFFSVIIAKSQDLSGKYVNELGYEVIIDKDYFYYVEPQTHLIFWHNDTLAKCIINRVNKDLIELNSINFPFIDVFRDCKITQLHDSTYKDGVEFEFLLPYNRKPNLRISIGQNLKVFKLFPYFIYSDTVKSIRLPNKSNQFNFTIAPESYFPHTVEGSFLGLLYVESPTYEMSSSCNRVVIELPHLTNDFFEPYYVKGEYARLVGNSIIWKGKTFKKIK